MQGPGLPFTPWRCTEEGGSPGAALAFNQAPAHKTVQDPHGSGLGNTSNFREGGCRGVPVVIQGEQERGSARRQISTRPFQAVAEKDRKRAKFVGKDHMHSLCMCKPGVKDNPEWNLVAGHRDSLEERTGVGLVVNSVTSSETSPIKASDYVGAFGRSQALLEQC